MKENGVNEVGKTKEWNRSVQSDSSSALIHYKYFGKLINDEINDIL